VLEESLALRAGTAGVRVLGPNSGGVIRPGRGLAASFLTCLDRPAHQIRSGRVGVVTQSGGTGSYLHNLAAARGGGLAVSVSTGNEIDIRLGEAIAASTRAEVTTVPVVNGLYGPMVTTAGLLGGEDHLRALRRYRDYDLALFSRAALNDDDLFLDDMRLEDLRAELPELQICPSDHITETLAKG